MFVDSHCHLQLIDYDKIDSSEAKAVELARSYDVEYILCVATKLDQYDNLVEIAKRYDNVSASIGVHPNEEDTSFSIQKLEELAKNPEIVAIGETGLDYFRTEGDGSIKAQQQKFRDHITVAKRVKKPIIVHTRQAKEDTIRILKEENASEIGGVIHCFTEDLDMAQRCIELGFKISFSGIVSFKNTIELQNVAKSLDLADILIETDCPYLAPTPMRGKINQPAYVKHVAEAIANLKGVSVEEVGRITTENYYSLFGKK